MKNLKILSVFFIAALISINSTSAKSLESELKESATEVANFDSPGELNGTSIFEKFSEVSLEEDASCTVEVKVGFLGLGGRVSATADTCEEAWAMVKALIKKK
ncbi:hypothetical protein [Ekhidna sp.]|uniref:hypothetical protein n=1 Tax=Ekhidna sp. TaxID=2608089 RepID=UPI0032EDE004